MRSIFTKYCIVLLAAWIVLRKINAYTGWLNLQICLLTRGNWIVTLLWILRDIIIIIIIIISRRPKKMYQWTLHGRRRRGRPQQSWKNQTKWRIYMISGNLEEDMAEDWHLWRLGVDGRLLVCFLIINKIIIIAYSMRTVLRVLKRLSLHKLDGSPFLVIFQVTIVRRIVERSGYSLPLNLNIHITNAWMGKQLWSSKGQFYN